VIKLRDKEINNFTEPYIIAEIGANHNGDMDLAKRMIKSAFECGVDAVKFQSWNQNSLVSNEEFERNQSYDDSPKKHFGSLREMVEKYYLREEQHFELKKYCESLGVEFSSTPFTKPEVDLLMQLDVPFIKVASMDINHLELLKYIAKQGKPILLSSGMSTLGEIEQAVRVIEEQGNNQIVILHCVSIYPPKNEDINLNNIKMLQKAFPYPIGFSDHSFGVSLPLASVALGCCLIEKHFTLDKDLPGWDHEISANPNELKVICEESKKIANALGVFKRIVSEDEKEKMKIFRRSIVLNKEMKVGDTISLTDLNFKRPGSGIRPDETKYVISRKLKKNKVYDELLYWEDLE